MIVFQNEDQSICIKTEQIKPNDTIIITVDPDLYEINLVMQLFDSIKKHFPNNKCIVTLKGVDINVESNHSTGD